VITVSQASI